MRPHRDLIRHGGSSLGTHAVGAGPRDRKWNAFIALIVASMRSIAPLLIVLPAWPWPGPSSIG